MKHLLKSKDVVRIVYKSGDVLHVFRFGKAGNEKIAPLETPIVQTYHFSKGQFDLANNGEKISMAGFFALDGAVCFDCPFSVSNGAKLTACYTHKRNQYSGFLSSIRSVRTKLTWDEIPELNAEIVSDILRLSKGLYIRFGTYGEPTLIPVDLVSALCLSAANWTGYTHQWAFRPEFSPFFMASCHSEGQAKYAESKGWRSFVAAKQAISGMVNCPASNEAGFKSTCNKCGLCSGTSGKGKKHVYILEH
jgi:hypothetical protein